jgi:hypothetical protein
MTAAIMKVTGTTDVAEIAAVLAAVSSARGRPAAPSPYEHWRVGRIAALRGSANGR